MQTYLMAFVVSDFHYILRGSTFDVPQRVFARPEAMRNDEGEFALATGLRVLRHQQEYFGTTYDLPKMDQIAIPDFAAGTLRAHCLL